MPGRLRFSTQLGGAPTKDEWAARCRRLEALGYSAVMIPDHVVGTQLWSVFPALTAAAVATTTLRVGTLVIANDFRNPLMLAREFATLDLISNGRSEVGLGAGWYLRDYESLGTPFDRGRVRVERLAESVTIIKRLFTEESVDFAGAYYQMKGAQLGPKAIQKPRPPILIAGGGRQILGLAAREADIIAVVPMFGSDGKLKGHREVTREGTEEKLAWVRDAAGSRLDEIELSMFLDITLTEDPEKTLDELSKQLDRPKEQITESVYRVIGTIDHVKQRVREMHELGFTYFTLRGPNVDELGPVVEMTER